MKMWAVDPGGVHVGMAEFDFGVDADGDQYADCVRAWELDPETAIDTIAAAMLNHQIDVLVVEEFRLFPDKAMEQTGSTMPTCELIGQIKWAHRLDCSHRRRESEERCSECGGSGLSKTLKNTTRRMEHEDCSRCGGRGRVLVPSVEFVLQAAAIQKPTQGVLRKRGIKSTAKREGAGGHALSAELHGWHWILRIWKAEDVA